MSINLKFSEISSDSGQRFYLQVFDHTELQPRGYVQLTELDQQFKFDKYISFAIQVYDWNEEDGKLICRKQKYSINTLIKECAEVHQFAVEYYPEYVI